MWWQAAMLKAGNGRHIMSKQANKAQTKANKAQSELFWTAIQQTPSTGAIASKDGKRYLRSK
jgi:hypothetical protein